MDEKSVLEDIIELDVIPVAEEFVPPPVVYGGSSGSGDPYLGPASSSAAPTASSSSSGAAPTGANIFL